MLQLKVNGQKHALDIDPDTPLLWALRDHLHLHGTKYGCGESLCGSCTVLVDGEAVRSCQIPTRLAEGREITTIEGLARDDGLHALQKVFVEEDAMQCGYCSPGMIMSAVALLREVPHPSREEIVKRLNGNICRCGNYTRILAAIRKVAAR